MKRRNWKQVKGKWQPVLLEEDVVEELTQRLWLQYRIKVWRVRERIPGVGALSTPGIPDLVGYIVFDELPKSCLDETKIQNRPYVQPLYIEVKRPGGARRTAQIQFIEDARRAGCVALFAESWVDVVHELDKQAGIKLKEAA